MEYIEIDPKVVGRNIRRKRKELNIKIDDLARALYLGYPQSIYMWEEGRRMIPTHALMNIMMWFDISVEDLLEEDRND